MNFYTIRKVALLGFMALSLAQCGDDKSFSKDAKLEVIPEDPVVIRADLTFTDQNGDEVTIKAPWIRVAFKMSNESTNTMYLVAFGIFGASSRLGSYETYTDPSEFCEDRAYTAVLDANEVYERVDSCDPFSPLAGATGGSDRYEYWFLYGLPEIGSNTYSFRVEAQGWFVDADETPIERLVSYGFITSQ